MNARVWTVTQFVHLLLIIIFALFFLFNFNFFCFFLMSMLFVFHRYLDHNSIYFDKLAPWWAVGSPHIWLPPAPWGILILPYSFCFLLCNFVIVPLRILAICISVISPSSIRPPFLLILVYFLILRLRLLLSIRIWWILNGYWLFWRYSLSYSFLLRRLSIFLLRVRNGLIGFIQIFL